jgi:Ca-activated chloride channel family protein
VATFQPITDALRPIGVARSNINRSGKAGAPDGLLNYESELIGLNDSGRLERPLTVVIPADGVTSADFPISLLNGVTPKAKSAYAVLTDWLRSPAAQQMITHKTSRRPVTRGSSPTRTSSATGC